jgi:hypothetical protein
VRLFLLLAVILVGLYVIALVTLVGAGIAVTSQLGWIRRRGRPVPGAPEAPLPPREKTVA